MRAVLMRTTGVLEENLGAAGLKLTFEDLREIESAASKIEVQGARYPAARKP